MIREAVLEDLPYLLEVGHKFFELTGLQNITSVEEADLTVTLTNMIESEDAVILIADGNKGAAGAISFPYYFNFKDMTGQEIFWWSEDSVGKELFEALEGWVQHKGLVSFNMIALEHSNPKRVGMIYERKGYKLLEHTYIKEF